MPVAESSQIINYFRSIDYGPKGFAWPWIQNNVSEQFAAKWVDEHYGRAENLITTEYDEDEEDEDYVPESEDDDEDDEDEDYDSSDDEDYIEDTADLDLEDEDEIDSDELGDLATDSAANPPRPFWEIQRDEAAEYNKREQEYYDQKEQEAIAAWNPDEFVAVMTEFYELMVAMGHWPEGYIQYPPHDKFPPVDVEYAKELGYSEEAIAMMLKLPYVGGGVVETTDAEGKKEEKWIDPSPAEEQSFFDKLGDKLVDSTYTVNYRFKHVLKECRQPFYRQTDIDGWMLPLFALCGRNGMVTLLDTKLGIMRSLYMMDTPSRGSIEYIRLYGDSWAEDGHVHYYRAAPLIPAVQYMRTVIDAYRSLKRLPIIDPNHNNPDQKDEEERTEHSDPSISDYYKRVKDRQQTLLKLYEECGWPHEWDRPRFLRRYKEEKDEYERRKHGGPTARKATGGVPPRKVIRGDGAPQ